MIEKFQAEFDKIITYCFIDLSKNKNLKEPFEILLNYLSNELNNSRRSIVSMNYNNYSTISRTPINPPILDNIEESSDDTNKFQNKQKKKCKSNCFCSIV